MKRSYSKPSLAKSVVTLQLVTAIVPITLLPD
jgi:hypothetical protein